MSKKLLTLLLIAGMLISSTACGGKEPDVNDNGSDPSESISAPADDSSKPVVNDPNAYQYSDGFLMETHNDYAELQIQTPEKKLNPEEIYSKITYNEKMFYGDYALKGGDEAEEEFAANAKYNKVTVDGNEEEITVIPYRFIAGLDNTNRAISKDTSHEWGVVYHYLKSSNGSCYMTEYIVAYTVENNKLKLTPVENYSYEQETNKISYTLSETVWEYDFSFRGRSLTISKDGESVTMTGGLDTYRKYDYFNCEHYLSPGSKAANGLDQIHFYLDAESGTTRACFEDTDEKYSPDAVVVLEENGLLTYSSTFVSYSSSTAEREEAKKNVSTAQFVYFYCANEGIILTDGTNTYYYNDSFSDRNFNAISDFVFEEQLEQIEKLPESTLEDIVEKKENLLDELTKAFADAGINVTVNEQTGELAMDATVLFGGDSAVLTDAGKEFVGKFIKAYTSIAFSEKYDGFISKTFIEGHSAPVAGVTYEQALPLSQNRAKSVMDYCLSAESGIDTSKLENALESVGYSNSKPILNEDGTPNMAACRRVSFRFMINLDA